MVRRMLTAVAALMLAAQAQVPAEQAPLARCLAGFLAAQQQAGAAPDEVVNALATACPAEERAHREAFVAAAAARGVRQVPADSEAHRQALALRNAYRDAYLGAQTTCARADRR